MEVRRPSAQTWAGRNVGTLFGVALVLAAGFVNFGVRGGLGLCVTAVLTFLVLAAYGARARLRVTPGTIAKRGLLRERTVAVPDGARLVRIATSSNRRWRPAADDAHHVVLDSAGEALVRWAGRWNTDPQSIARAAGLPFVEETDRALLPLRARYTMAYGLLVFLLVVTVIGSAVAIAESL